LANEDGKPPAATDKPSAPAGEKPAAEGQPSTEPEAAEQPPAPDPTKPTGAGAGATPDPNAPASPPSDAEARPAGSDEKPPEAVGLHEETVPAGRDDGPAVVEVDDSAVAPAAKPGSTNVVKEDLSGEHAKPADPPPAVKSFNLEEVQEKVRGRIAGSLVGLLFFIVVASFLHLWCAQDFASLKGVLELILAPVVALVGSATGFYFGGKGR